VPSGRVVAFLEGGYDLQALELCTAATIAALAGIEHRSEDVTSGERGRHVVAGAARVYAAALDPQTSEGGSSRIAEQFLDVLGSPGGQQSGVTFSPLFGRNRFTG